MRKYLIIMMLGFFLAGCGGEKASKPKEPGVVDYITGSESIKTYQKTKEKIRDINKTLEERNAGL